MALVLSGYSGTITLIDNGGNRSVKTYELTATTFTDALSDTQGIAALLDPLSTAVIERYSVNTIFTEDAFAWPANAQIENIAEVSVLLDTGINKSAQVQIPAPVTTLFLSTQGKGANIVNIAYAPLVSYVNIYAPGQYAYISDGENVPAAGAIQAGKRIHRASRKG